MVKSGQRTVRFGAGVRDAVPSSEFGNKAASLATMAQMGVPVPPGFSISVSVCEEYYREGEQLPDDFSSFLDGGGTGLPTGKAYTVLSKCPGR